MFLPGVSIGKSIIFYVPDFKFCRYSSHNQAKKIMEGY